MVLWMPWFWGMAGAMWLFFPLMVLAIVFWLWMLIDLLQSKNRDKLVWALLMIFLTVIGSVLYFFLVYLKRRK